MPVSTSNDNDGKKISKMISETNKETFEYIGKVKMDYSLYPGDDSYSDGDIEDEILKIVKEHEPDEFPEIIKERGNWPILYHLSEYRENILAAVPFNKQDEVLEVGAGCGAITGYLCRNAGKVTSVDLSKRRSLINAYRHKDADNLEIIVTNFEKAYENIDKKFDYVLLIGVLEYAKLYIGNEKPFETFLKKVGDMLKPGGTIVVAIENRFGLKYFAGCKEDHLGREFVGLNGYSQGTDMVQTFTKKELEDIIARTGFKNYTFYYPYPDYKFATTIYSDEYLPKKDELNNNTRNFDNSRLVIFDEKEVFNGLIDNGVFPVFSNSFLVLINKE